LRDLGEVLDDLGFSEAQKEKVRNILTVDLSFLLDVGPGVPPGWTPVEKNLKWPIPGVYAITSGFGPRIDPVEGIDGFHTGVDIGASQGTPVHAAASGVVAHAGWAGNYGLAVFIQHDGGMETIYAHLSGVAVRSGQVVQAGDVIGYVGSTGKSTGPHLHFEVRFHHQPVNPSDYFK
jgi:murein DD-endopeptidase MepM/ murein hydrolase activator NlpD